MLAEASIFSMRGINADAVPDRGGRHQSLDSSISVSAVLQIIQVGSWAIIQKHIDLIRTVLSRHQLWPFRSERARHALAR